MSSATVDAPWYQSRKLWIVIGAVAAIVAVALGGKALGLAENIIEGAIAGIAALSSVLLGTHAYTDVRAMGTVLANQTERDRDGRVTQAVEKFLPVLATMLGQLYSNRSGAEAIPTRDIPPSIQTPEGEAFALKLSDVPAPTEAESGDDYFQRILSFLHSRIIYGVIDPTEPPVRVTEALLTADFKPGTADETFNALVQIVSSSALYIVPAPAEPPDMSTPDEEPPDAA